MACCYTQRSTDQKHRMLYQQPTVCFGSHWARQHVCVLPRLTCVTWLAVQYSPDDVLQPRQESMLSDFGSDSQSDDDDDSDWDRFSSGEASSLEPAEAAAAARANPQAAEARKKETSLFGVTDKRLSAPLK